MRVSRWIVCFSSLCALSAGAATIDIAVSSSGDVTNYRYWGGGFADRGAIVDANPNQVSHNYEWGSGAAFDATLTFDLSAAAGLTAADLESASLNLDILSVWTSGRDDVASIGGVGSVLASDGTGWKSFNVLAVVGPALDAHSSTLGFTLSYTGYSGMTFGSAEGGQPAFLRLTTAAAVPEPESMSMMVVGLGVMGLLAKRRRS